MGHHEHLHAHAAREAQPDVATVVSVVYVTAEPTFSGPVGGYTTLDAQPAATNSAGPNFFDAGASSASAAPSPASQDVSSATSAAFPQSTYHINHSPPAGAQSTAATTFISSVVVSATAASSVISLRPDAASSSASLALSNAAPTAATSEPTSTGMSSGAKGGLAFAIIVIIALVMGVAFWYYRKKKAQTEGMEKLDDEKAAYHRSNASVSSHVSRNNQAPRLSLRPVTDMFPEMSEKQAANNGMLAANTPKTRGVGSTPISAASDANPFDDPVGMLNEKNGPGPAESSSPFTDAAAVAATPKPLNVAADRSAAANPKRQSPPGGMAPPNVHRVQMDFNPSMDDELDLKAGQLVRLIHEYDDGWALCKRMDGSQQGVVPRTCLSRLPVKPRPAGPPQGARGPPPAGRPRQESAAGRPPMGPQGAGRPRGPSNAPAPLNPSSRSRTNSSSTASNRMTPPAGGLESPLATSPSGSMPARKPVPGQAM